MKQRIKKQFWLSPDENAELKRKTHVFAPHQSQSGKGVI